MPFNINISTTHLFYAVVALAVIFAVEAIYMTVSHRLSYRRKTNARLGAMEGSQTREQVLLEMRRRRGLSTEGKFLLAKVMMARRYAVMIQDRELFRSTLVEVLQTPASIWPEQRLANEIAHRRAHRDPHRRPRKPSARRATPRGSRPGRPGRTRPPAVAAAARTGQVRADLHVLAAELVEERLAKGEESGYEFVLASDESGKLLGYACLTTAV